MRRSIVAIVLVVAACKGGKNKPSPEQAAAAKAAAVVPKVAVATVLAKADGVPPYLLLLDDAGQVRVGAAASWEALDANKLKITKKAMPLDHVDRHLREDFAMGRKPLETITSLDQFADDPIAIDLSDLEDTATRSNPSMQDDPPPPEEEDKPDDGADESGGTGTAMALEEGKMGKKDSDRAEGQYKMQKNQEDPQLARQQAIEQARAAGILGSKGGGSYLGSGPNEDGTPSRLAQIEGTVAEDGKLQRLRSMIFMAPTAKATKLIELVAQTDAAIAVSHEGKIRPLRLQFDLRDGAGRGSEYWLEVRVSAKGMVIEAVPDAPIEVATLAELGAALEKARTARGAEDRAPVDVLVDADIDVQRLVDVVVALDTAGVRTIGMGAAPNPDELSRRGKRMPRTTIGHPNAQGDLDKAVIRRVVKTSLPKITDCYAKGLATNPALAGTVMVQFFITPNGKVTSSTATGVDPDVAICVAAVIKALEFPKPQGGGGVQVVYPFTMRP